MAIVLGRGSYSQVFLCHNRVYKPFNLVSSSIKADQLTQFSQMKRRLQDRDSLLAAGVDIVTVELGGVQTEAISMPYTGAQSLDKLPAWTNPSPARLEHLVRWIGNVLYELERCELVFLDWKPSNIIQAIETGQLDLCDWDGIATEEDATNKVEMGICPIPRGTYCPFNSAHPATFTTETLRYAMAFAAAITVCVVRYKTHPTLSQPATPTEFLKRHQAVQTLLCSCLGTTPLWLRPPEPVLVALKHTDFFAEN